MLPVGSVVASLLLEKDFKDEMKRIARDQVWELASSQRIPAGRLQEIIRNKPEYRELNPQNAATLPDLRGVFLRGLHGARPDDNRGDVGDPRRLVGSFQADALGRHDHDLGPTYPNKPHAPDQDAGRRTHGSVGWDGYANARSSADGDKETRPRNVAVNYYVRVV